MKKKKLIWQIPFLLILIIGTIIIIRQQHNTPYQKDTGFIFGTIYHITYQSDTNYQQEIETELKKVDQSLSPFNKTSVITQVNQGKDIEVDEMFTEVFRMAESISKETNGAFDITVAPMVNLWGFGFKQGVPPTKVKIDSIKTLVGHEKVALEKGRIIKQNPKIMLDCSAIAKGYGSDIVARFLKKKGISNFMVEIGGEIVVNGVSAALGNRLLRYHAVRRARSEFKAYFDRVLTSEDFAESKPHPDCYLKGAAYFGVEPEDCVGLEDSFNGLKAVRASGAFTLGLATTNSREAIQPLSDYVIDDYRGFSFADLQRIVENAK